MAKTAITENVYAIAAFASLLVLGGCSSPTAPTATVAPVPTSVAVGTPSIPSSNPTPNPLLSDPRFNLSFYRQFVRNGYEAPNALQPLRRQSEAPRIYLRTVDDAGAPMDALSLDATAAALIDVTGKLTGVFGLAGLERGTDSREGVRGWITVRWSVETGPCGRAVVGGNLLTLYPRSQGCRCQGGPAVAPLIVKHEMGHALGFWHTDSVADLMHNGGHTACDMQPSAREQFHAAVAYSRPIGSGDP